MASQRLHCKPAALKANVHMKTQRTTGQNEEDKRLIPPQPRVLARQLLVIGACLLLRYLHCMGE